MRYITIIFILSIILTGCSKQQASSASSPSTTTPASHPGVQINDTNMYVSENPITGKPMTFWYNIPDSQKKYIQKVITNNNESFTITDKTGNKKQVIRTNMKIIRKVKVKQGKSFLYEEEQEVTNQNFEELSSCILKSTNWKDIPLTNEDVYFSILFWKYYEKDGLKYSTPAIGNGIKIPVIKNEI